MTEDSFGNNSSEATFMSNTYFVKRVACPGCTSTKLETIHTANFTESPIREYLIALFEPVGKIEFEYLNEATFILDKCSNCGLIFQEEIPNDFLMKKLYEEWIDPQKTFDNHQQSDDLAHHAQYAQEVMMMIAYFQTIPSQLKFFDFGMGWGKWARLAGAFGCQSYGTELSEIRIDYAKSHGIKVVSWEDIPNYAFDFINANQVFEHIPNPLEMLCHLRRALKPEGVIKIAVPDGQDIEEKLRIANWQTPLGSPHSLNPVSPLEHINCFDYDSLVKMAHSARLEVVKIPITTQFASSTYWQPFKPMLKNIVRPFYRNFFQKSTYLFFRPKANDVSPTSKTHEV